jgi:hypothetical protein
MVGKFRVEEPVLDTFPLSSTFRLTLVGTGGGVGMADGGL